MYFGISGPYNLCTMEKYFHERGLDARILKWIMQSDLERFSPCNLPFRDDLLHLIREQGRDIPSHPAYVACKRAAATSQGAELAQQPKSAAFDEQESIGRLLPPVALFHGEIDKSVPYTVAVEFAENLKLAGVVTHLRIYEHWSHTDPILEGPMGGDDSLCYDMMVAYSKVLKARALYESKRNGAEAEEESKAAWPQHADAVESTAEQATPARQEAADPASTKSAKRKAKKKRQQQQQQAAAVGIDEQQAGEASTASIVSELESSALPVCAENDIPIVQALLEPASTLCGLADDVINVQTLASKRPPMASAFFIHVARYVNPF